MTVIRAQCSWQIDSANPTDVLVITPHFNTTNVAILEPLDAQQLADDLAAALDTYVSLHTQLTVKLYDAKKVPPSYPLATKTVRAGTIASSPSNRDIALCLSYYAGVNRPRYRGRLYIPLPLVAVSGSANTATPANLTRIGDIVPVFTGLGGVNVDWVVFSRRDNTARPISNWYVDNSWDSQRRRGGRATSRLTGTTTEDTPPNLVALQAPAPADDRPPVSPPSL